MFLDGLSDFITQNKIAKSEIEVNFYGIDLQAEAKNRLLNYKTELDGYVIARQRIPYADLLKKCAPHMYCCCYHVKAPIG